MNVKEALEGLDPENTTAWTVAGLPELDAISAVVGRKVERDEATAALPGWDRDKARAARAARAPGAVARSERAPSGRSAEDITRDENSRFEKAGAEAIALSKGGDAIALMEAVCIVAAGERYRRNSVIQQVVRLWQNDGNAAKERQRMLEDGEERRADRRAKGEEDARAGVGVHGDANRERIDGGDESEARRPADGLGNSAVERQSREANRIPRTDDRRAGRV